MYVIRATDLYVEGTPRDSSKGGKAREREPLTGTGTGNILDPLR
jgi:hypothetical protein